MRYDIYTLPEITIVGGQSKTLGFNLWTSGRERFDADGCNGNFSVVNYSNKSGDVVISKPVTFESGDDPNVHSVATVELLSADTATLFGKYVYQLTIQDGEGNAEIPNQGILYVAYNVNRDVLG